MSSQASVHSAASNLSGVETRHNDDESDEEEPSPSNESNGTGLPLGTFAAGNSIYRNQLRSILDPNNNETFESGHVHPEHLCTPNTHSVFMTSFTAPEINWMASWLGDEVSSVFIVHSPDAPPQYEIGYGRVQCMVPNDDTKKDWVRMVVKPHTGIMHSKLLMFRCPQGVRVVICGANLYQDQFENQRDVLWVQDFWVSSKESKKQGQDHHHETENTFGEDLKDFCDNLTIAAPKSEDQPVVDRHLSLFFRNIDYSKAAATLVYSFPRRGRLVDERRGGWKCLAGAVKKQMALQKEKDRFELRTVIRALEARHGGKKRRRTTPPKRFIHVMTGSLGDVQPNFLTQMKNAMRGHENFQKFTTWSDVLSSQSTQFQIYWPGQLKAQTMNLISIAGNMRAISKTHWEAIPSEARQQLFCDTENNPDTLDVNGFYPISHAKIMFSTYHHGGRRDDEDETEKSDMEEPCSILYVGSHNFSAGAWGCSDSSPKNVELGVVLSTSSRQQRLQWIDRLPYSLSYGGSAANYVPLSGHEERNKTRAQNFAGYHQAGVEDFALHHPNDVVVIDLD